MARKVQGGPIQPVYVVSDAELDSGRFRLAGGPVIPVSGFQNTDKRRVKGGVATPVYVVSDARMAEGRFRLQGGPAVPMGNISLLGMDRRVGGGDVAIPVYVEDGLLSSGGGGAGARSYATILQEDYGADEVWPLVDIASGTTIHAHVNGNRDGSLTGWDLQNATGPVTGTDAPFSDGANDYGDIDTASLDGLWDGDEYYVLCWAKVDGAAVWTDGEVRGLVKVAGTTTTDNLLSIFKISNNTIRARHRAGGSTNNFDVSFATSTTAWFSIIVTVSASAGADGEMKVYFGELGSTLAQQGSTQTGLTGWSDSALGHALIGSDSQPPLRVWHGPLAYVAAGFGAANIPDLSAAQAIHDAASTAAAD